MLTLTAAYQPLTSLTQSHPTAACQVLRLWACAVIPNQGCIFMTKKKTKQKFTLWRLNI